MPSVGHYAAVWTRRASEEAERSATAPAAEAPQSRTEQAAQADSRGAPAPAAAPKSNWEAAELARRAAASKPSRAPADAAPEAPSQREHGDLAQPSSDSLADSRQARASTAAEMPPTAQGERLDSEFGAPEGDAQSAAAQKAAVVRRNDEDRIAAARERFLARKRKFANV